MGARAPFPCYANTASALSARGKEHAAPKSRIEPNKGGLTSAPVIATRRGISRSPSLTPSPSA